MGIKYESRENHEDNSSAFSKKKGLKKRKRNQFVINVARHVDWEEKLARRCFWTPQAAVLILSLAFAALISIGIAFLINNYSMIECKVYYGDQSDGTAVNVTLDVTNKDCDLGIGVFELPGRNINVYYTLEGFYQNDVQYFESKSEAQLQGQIFTTKDAVKSCFPLDVKIVNGTEKILHPCGAMAWSVFNDKITLMKRSSLDPERFEKIEMDETRSSISWIAQASKKYKNPSLEDRRANRHKVYFWMHDDEEGDIPSSLNEREKLLVSTIQSSLSFDKAGEAAENAHFLVWMRNAAFPNFRKFYSKVTGPLPLPLRLQIESRYPVGQWKGRKAVVLASSSWVGGRSFALALFCLIIGTLLLLVPVAYVLKFGSKFFHTRDIRWL